MTPDNTDNIGGMRYCLRKDIDDTKWNQCIQEAGNGLIYALSDYLDVMAPPWDALILNDYEVVMPLPWRRKYGISYLYQPYFMPNLGLFGNNLNHNTVLTFLKSIPKKFRYWNIDLNEGNHLPDESNLPIGITVRVHYELNLHQPYDDIRKSYRKLCSRMLNKALKHGIVTNTVAEPSQVVNFYKEHYGARHQRIDDATYHKLLTIARVFCATRNARVYLASIPGGELVAAYLALIDERHVYFIIGGSSELGKQFGAFYQVTDTVIKDFAGTDRTFRFEGSDISGIAFFNEQFGAQVDNYLHLHKNALPFPLNYLKN
jgi:hypothetical protein